MRHMELPLAKGGSKGGSLLRGEVGWVRAGLGGMRTLEVLGQITCDQYSPVHTIL